MAVILKSNIAGADIGDLSTAAKPTANVPNGWVFLEFDTGNKFVFNAGIWHPLTEKQTTVGSLTNVTHTVVPVGIASTSVLPANANRKYLLLINDSDTTIYVSLNGAASNGSGIRINPNGGSYELRAGSVTTGAITAINNVGTKNLLVTEGV